MLDPAIVAYRRLPDADAALELTALGLPVAEALLVFWQRVVARQIDHWTFQTFDVYRQVPSYHAAQSDRFALYAVEEEGLGDGIRVSVMLAARRGDATIGGQVWDGTDMDFVRRNILLPRLVDYFS